MAIYIVKNQWGKTSSPWHDGGLWDLGARKEQDLVKIAIQSNDNGKTFEGIIVYENEGEIALKATLIDGNNYTVESQWGGDDAPWNPEGNWIIGARDGQLVVELNVSKVGNHMVGQMTYDGEGPIRFEGTKEERYGYTVENQWGGDDAPWNLAGTFILGARTQQKAIAFDLKSDDEGKTLTGTMTYDKEGPIGFKGTLTNGDNYTVENQWGGDEAPWHEGGTMVIGTRSKQSIVALNISSNDNGRTFTGTATYEGEGPIGFKGAI